MKCINCGELLNTYSNQDGMVYCSDCDEIIGERPVKVIYGKIKFYKSKEGAED